MPHSLPLNDGWEFMKKPTAAFFSGESCGAETVRLPHTGTMLPYNYTDEASYGYVSGYRKTLRLNALPEGRRLFVVFDGAAQRSRLQLNGVTLLTHSCGYTGFSAELTPGLQAGNNLLALELDSREKLDQPPFGNVIDYLTYQGIYRGCRLILTGPSFFGDVYVHTRGTNVSAEVAVVGGGVLAVMKVSDAEGSAVAEDRFLLRDVPASELPLPAGLPIREEECRKRTLRMDCPGVRLWSPAQPSLYTLTLTLLDGEGQPLDTQEIRFGFRDAEFREDGFYLNGEKLILRGLDRHQSYPYAGYAMPDSAQRRDAEILRKELGLNVVRTSHYPQSQAFLDRCDELGLLVFTEIPGWQHIGGDGWKVQAIRNVDDMVAQDRNHPCVILWGVRINESADDDTFYRLTNEKARALDPYRQTGGVRCFRQSRLLEDVYTYNDFLHSGENPGLAEKREVVPDPAAPYLVTEYNGHMFPTKSFDDEPHRTEHALRHARVLNAMYGRRDMAGCIGWCAFDYNTHVQFGSGDRICYHGVMDMFRNPKPAAAVYASQQEETPVLELSSTLDKGDWPASVPDAVWAFTNADSVRVWRNGVFLREFLPDRETFPHLPHPPVRMADFSGPELRDKERLDADAEQLLHQLWEEQSRGKDTLPLLKLLKRKHNISADWAWTLRERYACYLSDGPLYRFEAVRNGTVAAVVQREAVKSVSLRLEAAEQVLREEGMWASAEVRITAVDQHGNRLWYAGDPLLLETEGPLEIIGPKVTSLRGGAAGVWLRTTGEKGEAKLRVAGLGPRQEVEFRVE